MDDIVRYFFIAFVAGLFGFYSALAPNDIVQVHGDPGKILTVEYKQNVYKLVLLEQ